MTKAKVSSNKKIFISYSTFDNEFVEKLDQSLSTDKSLTVIRDERLIKAGNKIDPLNLYKGIDGSDIFLLVLSNSSLQSGWVKIEYDYALKKIETSKDFLFIPLLIEDIDDEVKMPFPINAIKHIDFRNPFSFIRDFDKLLFGIYGISEENQQIEEEKYQQIREVVYNLSFDPNIEVTRLQRILENSLEKILPQYLKPINENIDLLTKLSHASERIMTLEAIAEKEKSVSDSVWIVSSNLNNDVLNDKIKESVKKNQKAGIRYTYFVLNTPPIKKRIAEYKEIYDSIFKDRKNDKYCFIEMKDDEIVMPFEEIAIYDPDDYSNTSGYVLINFDLPIKTNSVFLKISHRYLFPLTTSLRGRLDRDKNI
ncbi:MAG: toll/interleukin-1 receptor domain-containing protein [Candidatus Hatepunaea meridiana]|nr:toll/interleukin-1 receptor domain-containing protein [Candidatus Hatepunaea meridiana]